MTLQIEYGNRFIEWEVSTAVDVAGMQTAPPAVAMPDAVWDALERPIQSPGLSSIAESKIVENVTATAVIVVSDNTRPVPYFGKAGLIYPIVRTLIEAGFAESQITILIGAGSHRNMDDEEIESMIGLRSMGLFGVKVSNHEYTHPIYNKL